LARIEAADGVHAESDAPLARQARDVSDRREDVTPATALERVVAPSTGMPPDVSASVVKEPARGRRSRLAGGALVVAVAMAGSAFAAAKLERAARDEAALPSRSSPAS